MSVLSLFEQHRQYLYHGTHLLGAMGIMQIGRIVGHEDDYGKPAGVSCAREYRIASNFADRNEQLGALDIKVIFVIDWEKIKHRQKTQPFWYGHYPIIDGDDPKGYKRESEEVVLGDVPLSGVTSINFDVIEARNLWKTHQDHIMRVATDLYGDSPEAVTAMFNTLITDPRVNRLVSSRTPVPH